MTGDPRDVADWRLDEPSLRAWGRRLGAAAARDRVVVALFGPLGAGKSTLARAAARGAGVEGPVPSPTYTLVNEHPIPGDGGEPTGATFFHADLYRLSGGRALDEIGWNRILAARGPVFVEWADRAEGDLPEDRWEVRLGIPAERSLRRVELRRKGSAPAPPAPQEPEDRPAGASPEGAGREGRGPC